MLSRKELKQKSKDQLKGQWTIPVLLTLILGVISFINGKIGEGFITNSAGSILYSIISTLVTVVIGIAVTAFYLRLTRKPKIEFSDVLIDGKTAGKAIGIELLVTLIMIPIMLVLFLLVTFLLVISLGSTLYSVSIWGTPVFATKDIIIILLLSLIIIIPLIIVGSYLALPTLFLCEDNSRGVWECIKLSFEHMHGNIWRYIVLQLSFIGWAILCVFTLGIGMLWLIPYITTTSTNFFNDVTGYDDRNINNYSEFDFPTPQ